MATALSAALAPLPYNSETNNGAKSAAGSDRLRARAPNPAQLMQAVPAPGSKAWLEAEHTRTVQKS